MKLVASDTEPYTGEWFFPPKSDKGGRKAYTDYTDIKHLISPPQIVGSNSRPHFIVPKVVQHWPQKLNVSKL